MGDVVVDDDGEDDDDDDDDDDEDEDDDHDHDHDNDNGACYDYYDVIWATDHTAAAGISPN